MNPGIGEEVGATTRTAIEALKSTPAILFLVLFNALVMGVLVFVSVKNAERWDKEIARWVEFAQACQKS